MSQTSAGGAAPAPAAQAVNGTSPARPLTAQEKAASARAGADEAARFAAAIAQQLADFKEHAAGGIAGLESALEAAQAAADEAAAAADEAEAAAGITPEGT